jgi:hypothetical protein
VRDESRHYHAHFLGLQKGFEEIDEEILERVDSVEEVLGFGALLVIVAGDKDKR